MELVEEAPRFLGDAKSDEQWGSPSSSVWIFQTNSTLTTATGSTVTVINGGLCSNVFWQVGSSATLSGSVFAGNILALSSITVNAGVTVHGRALARNGAVTLHDDTFTKGATCASSSPPPTTTTTTTSTTASTTAATEVIPKGPPQTGAGGASHSSRNGVLIAIGAMALVGAGASTAQALRRRRALDGPGSRDA